MEITAYFGAPEGARIEQREFEEMVRQFVENEFLATPCGLGVGKIQKDPARACSAIIDGEGRGVDVRYSGEDTDVLFQEFRGAAFGEANIGIAFRCFNYDNNEIRHYLESHAYANAEVLFCALAEPTQYSPMSGKICLQYYMATSGKNGPEDIEGAPFEKIVAKTLGGRKKRQWGMTGF